MYKERKIAMKKYKATMYVRLSNSDDIKNNEESNSIVNQKRLIQDYVKNQPDIEIVSEKVDDGYSGIIFERPAFSEMIEDIESGKINCIIVKDLSRFGREYIETGRYLQKVFPAYGVRFIAINDNIDTEKENSSNDSLITSFKSLINDSYCRDISIKTRTALDIKRKKGEYIGASPKYGYVRSKDNKHQLVIDEYAAQVVKDIYAMKIEGISALSIANKLNDLGVLSPIEYKKEKGLPYPKGGHCDNKDSKWSATSVIRILSDEIYIGNLVQGKKTKINYKINKQIDKPKDEWIRVENTHEAIIDKKTFELVQRTMLLDTRTAPNSEGIYLFSGILVCGYCGNRMTRKTVRRGDKKYIYYNCPITKKQGCKGELIREDKLIECTLHSIKAHIDSIISIDEILKNIDEKVIEENKINKINETIKTNENKIKELNLYKSTLYKNMIDGILSKEEHKRYKNNYDLEIADYKQAISTLESEIKNIKKREMNKLIKYFKSLENVETLDRKIVISLINSILIKNKNSIKINFNYKHEFQEKLVDA